MLNLEITFDPGLALGVSAQRKADHAVYDFASKAFVAPGTAAVPVTGMTEWGGYFAGLYTLSYGPTPGAIWWDGDILIGIHDLGTASADGKSVTPRRCLFRFAVPFSYGNSLYVPPPFYSY